MTCRVQTKLYTTPLHGDHNVVPLLAVVCPHCDRVHPHGVRSCVFDTSKKPPKDEREQGKSKKKADFMTEM